MSKRTLFSAALALVWAATAAQDGDLKDPMRPFRPSAAARSMEPRFRLTAILVSDERRVAVINGRALRVGDAVDGAQLTAVRPSSVELRRGSRTFTVSLRRRSDQDK